MQTNCKASLYRMGGEAKSFCPRYIELTKLVFVPVTNWIEPYDFTHEHLTFYVFEIHNFALNNFYFAKMNENVTRSSKF